MGELQAVGGGRGPVGPEGPHGVPLLEVSDLRVEFPTSRGVVRAVRGVSFSLDGGESVAILGESGSGKSVTSRAVLGLVGLPMGRVSGVVRFEGRDVLGLPDEKLRGVRGPGMAVVFQDSLNGLNPVFSIGAQISEIFRVRLGWSRREAYDEAKRLLAQVGIPDPQERLKDYPHQFSGGMRQRVCIAMGIALHPQLLIADEPTTALDVTVQADILRLISRLQQEHRMALLFITHDLSVARVVADRLIVMYAGKIVEEGPLEEIYRLPAHPYTKALLQSHPGVVRRWSDLRPISGSPPGNLQPVVGCPFHPRCPMARDVCASEEPGLLQVGLDRKSRCHFFRELIDSERSLG